MWAKILYNIYLYTNQMDIYSNGLAIQNGEYQNNEPSSPCFSKCTEKTDYSTSNHQIMGYSDPKSEPSQIIWEPIWQPVLNFQQHSANTFFNNICIFCKKITDPRLIKDIHKCVDPYGRFYISHSSCIAKNQLTHFYLFTNRLESFPFQHRDFQNQNPIIGAPQYLTEIKIYHPIHQLKLFQTFKVTKDLHGVITCDLNARDNEFDQLFVEEAIIISRHFRIEVNNQALNCQGTFKKQRIQLDISINLEGGQYQKISGTIGSQLFQLQCQVLKGSSLTKSYISKIPQQMEVIKINWLRISENIQSPEQFSQNFNDDQIGQQIIQYIKTLNGSKEYQKYFATLKTDEKIFFLHSISSQIPSLIQDQYANYLMQKICQDQNIQVRQLFLSTISTDFTQLICENYGTFVFQALLSKLTQSSQFDFLSFHVCGKISHLSVHKNATHFIRKFIEVCDDKNFQKICSQLLENFLSLSLDKNSVCVMKILLRRCKTAKKGDSIFKVRQMVIQKVKQNLQVLICSEFGNYLVQQLFQNFKEEQLSQFSQYIADNFFDLSCKKYSSIIVAKMVSHFWKKNKFWYKQAAQKMSTKKMNVLQNDREGKKVVKQIKGCKEECVWWLKSLCEEINYKSFHKNKQG